MKRILLLPLAIIIGFSFQSQSLLAQDQGPTKGDKKDAEAAPKGGKGINHATRNAQRGTGQGMGSHGDKSSERTNNSSTAGAFAPANTATFNSKAINEKVLQSVRGQTSRQQTTAFAVQGNQANHYDGHWFAASSHSDWDQHIDHRWRNQDYRWYDGGWLIIDAGSAPGYNTGGSIGTSVQASLAQQGYYAGPIDGYIGRGTRRAISHYESDNGLQVNGVIDEPLLVSLRLE